MSLILGEHLKKRLYEALVKNTTFVLPTSLRVSLHSAQPDETGSNELHLTSGTAGYSPGYARGTIAIDTSNASNANWTAWDDPNNRGKNNVACAIGSGATGDWNQPGGGGAAQDIGFVGFWDQAGNAIAFGDLTTPKKVTNGASPSFAINSFTLQF